ncbi:MAG TPA: hypothetical protein VER17_01195 [Tepidisphaeraceae bacterium]|nr:hypothetical protein [Tepidisphaeraceae bacterium]
MSQLMLQVPDAVLEAARRLAARQQMSVEQFVLRMVEETVRMDDAWEQRVSRGRGVSRERFLAALAKAPDVPPIPGDELP